MRLKAYVYRVTHLTSSQRVDRIDVQASASEVERSFKTTYFEMERDPNPGQQGENRWKHSGTSVFQLDKKDAHAASVRARVHVSALKTLHSRAPTLLRSPSGRSSSGSVRVLEEECFSKAMDRLHELNVLRGLMPSGSEATQTSSLTVDDDAVRQKIFQDEFANALKWELFTHRQNLPDRSDHSR
eukprot:3618684-Prymnesium_polylepis.1